MPREQRATIPRRATPAAPGPTTRRHRRARRSSRACSDHEASIVDRVAMYRGRQDADANRYQPKSVAGRPIKSASRRRIVRKSARSPPPSAPDRGQNIQSRPWGAWRTSTARALSRKIVGRHHPYPLRKIPRDDLRAIDKVVHRRTPGAPPTPALLWSHHISERLQHVHRLPDGKKRGSRNQPHSRARAKEVPVSNWPARALAAYRELTIQHADSENRAKPQRPITQDPEDE